MRNADALVRDPERFAQTGVGWVMRELSLADRERVVAFAERGLVDGEAVAHAVEVAVGFQIDLCLPVAVADEVADRLAAVFFLDRRGDALDEGFEVDLFGALGEEATGDVEALGIAERVVTVIFLKTLADALAIGLGVEVGLAGGDLRAVASADGVADAIEHGGKAVGVGVCRLVVEFEGLIAGVNGGGRVFVVVLVFAEGLGDGGFEVGGGFLRVVLRVSDREGAGGHRRGGEQQAGQGFPGHCGLQGVVGGCVAVGDTAHERRGIIQR
ncbi:MAG: DNA alkylation repair protein [Phycisphaeraceae bacterium]